MRRWVRSWRRFARLTREPKALGRRPATATLNHTMFAPPPVLATEVFARVPDTLRIRDRKSRWAAVYRQGRPIDCFIEGPSFDRAGNLYVVDLAWDRILRVTPGGGFSCG